MMASPDMSNPFFNRPQFGDVPVGAITAFAGALGAPDSGSPPTTATPTMGVTSPIEAWGWMLCDGRSLACAQYPELFAVLGYTYGGSDNTFNIPDYRGYFLRGIGAGTSNDPDIATRTAPPGGQSSGVGSTQSFALQTHEHTYNTAPAPASAASGDPAAAPATTTALTVGGPVAAQGQTGPVMVSQYETRPLNVYVNYIIKFTYGLRSPMR
jgi:microcystin-dependent protein